MPNVTGTFLLPDGTPRDFAEVAFAPAHAPAVLDDDRIIVRGTVRGTTDSDGDFSQALLPGFYRVTIDRRAAFDISVPESEADVPIGTIVVTGGIPALQTGLVWFGTIAEMLATDGRTWKQARTRNSYGTDGVISGWDRVLVTDAVAAGLTPDTDRVLATDDGFALCVRTFISG